MTHAPFDSERYRSAAAHYEKGRVPYAPALIRRVAEVTGLGSEHRVLDLGCGPGPLARSFAPLVPWGAAQQWVLQTVVLREAQRAWSRRAGVVIAALLFGAVHLPNPFLASITAGAALVWCWIYDRYPNVFPLAISHALGTLAILYAFDEGITGRLRIGASYLRLGL